VEVEQPVIVLKGTWQYRPVEGTPWVGRQESPPVLEIYGAHLDAKLEGRTAFSEGDIGSLGGVLSSHVGKEIAVQATGAPSRIRWYFNYKGNGTPESAAAARDVDLVVRHICEQTGLTRGEEKRTLRRLTITQIGGPRLP
jgi:hypothetical protein